MPVGVIAHKVSVVNPQHTVGAEAFLQFRLNLVLGQRLVAVGRHQASRGSEYRTLAVALYRTAFEHEVVAVDIFAVHHPRVEEVAVDGIVELRLKLLAPSVETEVEQLRSGKRVLLVAVYESDEAVVARPCVVGVAFHVSDAWRVGHELPHLVGFGSHDYESFALGYFPCHPDVGVGDLWQDWLPIRVGVRPCEHHCTLRCPFCRKHLLGLVL